MNPEFPPLRFPKPDVRLRRRQRNGFQPGNLPTPEQRRLTAQRVIAETKKMDRELSKLTPEQRRAVILKLRHDRPLTLADIRGTGLGFLGEPGDTESLVIPKQGDLSKLANRAQDFESGAKKSLLSQPGLLAKLTGMEVADAKERVSDEMLKVYNALTQQDHVIYEIEVSATSASHESTKKREVEGILAEISKSIGRGIHGHVYDTDFQSEGAILMVWTTGKKLKEWVEDPHWRRKITRFELRPKFQTMKEVFDAFNVGKVTIEPPPPDAETICVIDSGVATGNPFLGPMKRRAISRSWVYGASPLEDVYGHGSGVASLAGYHSISYADGDENQASAWVTSARIMTDDGELDSPRLDEPIEDRAGQAWLLSNILKEIVEHYAPLGVRIFVLAFEMQGHIWSHATRKQVARNAWIARTLDQLSRQHDVVFVGITGNIAAQEAEELQEESQTSYPQYLLTPFAKLLDPGPSALAVTCGSIAHSTHVVGAAHGLIADLNQPSPFTRSGPGFGDSTKPDVVEYGGSLVRDLETDRIVRNMGTDVVMASNAVTPALQRNIGTSFAAPRVANHLAKILRDAKALAVVPSAALLRAFLAASCRSPDLPITLNKDDKLALAGHGRPDGNEALLCRGYSAVLYWDGDVDVEATAIFRIHVPDEIRQAGRSTKRITVAVAMAPPVQRWGLGEYLGANLKFWLYQGDKPSEEIIAQHQREADAPNEAPKASTGHMDGILGITARSMGTLQRDVFEWSEHKEGYSADDYTLAVSVWGAASWLKETSIPLAVVVRVEETSGQYQQLYARISARVRALA